MNTVKKQMLASMLTLITMATNGINAGTFDTLVKNFSSISQKIVDEMVQVRCSEPKFWWSCKDRVAPDVLVEVIRYNKKKIEIGPDKASITSDVCYKTIMPSKNPCKHFCNCPTKGCISAAIEKMKPASPSKNVTIYSENGFKDIEYKQFQNIDEAMLDVLAATTTSAVKCIKS